jgi:hypothetical protein
MDTSTLVVGQDVRIKGIFTYSSGKVVEVTPEGVVVVVEIIPVDVVVRRELLRFDKDGKGKWGNGSCQCLPVLDIKTLVVGQDVVLSSGISSAVAKVIEISPTGGIMQIYNYTPDVVLHDGGFLCSARRAVNRSTSRDVGCTDYDGMVRFDINGRAVDSRDLGYTYFNGDPIPGTFEGGPWEIEELYSGAFAEREALYEKTRQKCWGR